MYEMNPPAVPSLLDVQDGLLTVRTAHCNISDRLSVLGSEIRLATSIQRLAELHDMWALAVEEQESAERRIAELLELLGSELGPKNDNSHARVESKRSWCLIQELTQLWSR